MAIPDKICETFISVSICDSVCRYKGRIYATDACDTVSDCLSRKEK